MVDVIAVGNANIDLMFTITYFPKPDEEVLGKDFRIVPGGSASNFAVAISRLGVATGLIASLGDDAFGQLIMNNLKNENIDISHIKVIKNFPTGIVTIFIDEHGERRMIAYRGANLMLSKDDIDVRYIKSAKLVHLSGTKLDLSEYISSIAKHEGLTVSFDPGSVISSMGIIKCKTVLSNTDILFVNRLEIIQLTGIQDILNGVYELINYGPSIVVVKLGSEGSLAVTKNKKIRVPAFKVKVINTTGAGDAFDAGFLKAFLFNMKIEDALKIGNAVAALSITKPEPRLSFPKFDEVAHFLRTQTSS
ncbi:MAG: carbohydrate kinase family protein [Thermoprotei archaeon]